MTECAAAVRVRSGCDDGMLARPRVLIRGPAPHTWARHGAVQGAGAKTTAGQGVEACTHVQYTLKNRKWSISTTVLQVPPA